MYNLLWLYDSKWCMKYVWLQGDTSPNNVYTIYGSLVFLFVRGAAAGGDIGLANSILVHLPNYEMYAKK